jgi:methyl acetate hydrolase
MALPLVAGLKKVLGVGSLDDDLRSAITRHKIPAASAMVATAEKTTYAGTFGTRDSASGMLVTTNSIFRIASMTKPITTVAALQLVEREKLTLDEPVSRHLTELENLQVLEGFDKETGKPILRPARKPVTLRRLLTHTSGFAYPTWDENLLRYTEKIGMARVTPLVFEPGTRWEYGTNLDWTGRLVEAVSGQTLEDYFQKNILQPLGMRDTSFILAEEKFERLVGDYSRQADGSLKENPRKPPAPPKSFNGGGGLYSTAPDYVRFMQMILRRGRGDAGQQILRAKTIDMMTSNQTGELGAGRLKSFQPDRSSDVDFHPGFSDRFGFGFLINTSAYDRGRSAGSLAWAGIENTFFWIDPHRGVCAVLLMQFLPFVDAEAVGALRDFERAVYRNL